MLPWERRRWKINWLKKRLKKSSVCCSNVYEWDNKPPISVLCVFAFYSIIVFASWLFFNEWSIFFYYLFSSCYSCYRARQQQKQQRKKKKKKINCKRNPTTIKKTRLLFFLFSNKKSYSHLICLVFAWVVVSLLFLILPLRVVFLIFLSFCTS